jgi:uncharacterized protein (TIGR02611 family)
VTDREQHHERLERIRRAAIEAEFETGRHEDTVEEARDAIHIRLARMTGGLLLLVTGIVMLPLPGPGWLVIGISLAILSRDFLWAERTLERVKDRLPQDEDGDVHPRVIAFSVVMFVLATSVSIWWSFIR